MQHQASIILASASPRRKELLAEAGFEFSVVPAEIDESAFEQTDARKCAEQLALAKAKKVAGWFPDSLVIGADTVVDFNGQIIGKPADERQALAITKKLFSAPHKVITAIALVRVSDGVEIVESDSTTVFPKALADKQMEEHIKSGLWRNKAGAYAIKENGDEFVERIEGSITNVMGLPMELLRRLLRQFS